MKTLTDLYYIVFRWKNEQGFDSLTEHDIIALMQTQALLLQNERLERIGDKLVEVETALDRLRLSKDEGKYD